MDSLDFFICRLPTETNASLFFAVLHSLHFLLTTGLILVLLRALPSFLISDFPSEMDKNKNEYKAKGKVVPVLN
jgi:hypothetical protein